MANSVCQWTWIEKNQWLTRLIAKSATWCSQTPCSASVVKRCSAASTWPAYESVHSVKSNFSGHRSNTAWGYWWNRWCMRVGTAKTSNLNETSKCTKATAPQRSHQSLVTIESEAANLSLTIKLLRCAIWRKHTAISFGQTTLPRVQLVC